MTTPGRADYGIDAPDALRNITVGGFIIAALGGLFVWLGWLWPSVAAFLFAGFTFLSATVFLGGTKVGKLREAERLLDGLALRGDERVLDAGCGRGLMLVGAAERLTSGHAVGVDLWTRDQSGNRASATLANAATMDVKEKVTVVSGDVRSLPLRDRAFDVALSSLVLDNLHSVEGWTEAVREMARVVKPGGRVVISDIRNWRDYEAVLRDEGWTDIETSGRRRLYFPPLRIVTGRRPA